MKDLNDNFFIPRALQNQNQLTLSYPPFSYITFIYPATRKIHFHLDLTSNPRHERPHKPTRNLLRKPIPFLNNIKEIQDPDEALSLFHEYHQMGFKHDYPPYSSLIYKLARARKFEAVEILLHFVQNYNIRCGETIFLTLIKHFGKAKLVDKTIELFRKMKAFNCVHTVQSFNILVDNYRFDDANEMFASVRKMSFWPNGVSFNSIMIKG